MMQVRLEPVTPLSRVKHSTTEPLRSHTPGYDNKKVPTCNNIFNLSRGAVAVLDTAPAVPPDTRWRHHIPVCISFSVKSSGTIVLSPISIIYREKINIVIA